MSLSRGSVLFLSHDASRTGAPIVLLNLLRWLHRNRELQAHILIGASFGDLIPEFQALGSVHTYMPERTLLYRVLRRLKLHGRITSSHQSQLRAKLSQSDIRLIYANSVVSARMVEYLSFLNCPVVCHVHELDIGIKYLGPETISLLEKYVCRYIAVSPAVKANLVENHGVAPEKVTVIQGMVPIADYLKAPQARGSEEVRRELNIAPEARIVCGCGSIEARKGTDLFLQVADQVLRQYRASPVHFIWVGGTPEALRKARRQVAASAAKDVVHFIGQRADVVPYFDACDVYLLTSREEALPLVMLEVALRQKPIICFDRSGHPPEFVRQDAGFAVPDFDANKMSEKLIELLSNPELGRRMGAIGKQRAIDNYDLTNGAAEIAAILESRGQPSCIVSS
jgi:glycosyltransferase involved in cell wall biosynthesis